MAKQAILILGGQGSGKGTQAKNLEDQYGFVQISMGELLRERRKVDDAVGNMIANIQDAGGLVPDDVTASLLEEHILQLQADRILFDGFPRNGAQVVIFEELLQKLGIEVLIPIYLHVDEKELVKRLLNRATIEGRADDNEEAIAKRLQLYNEVTKPVIEHYAKSPNFIQVDGSESIEVIWEGLKETLGKRL